MRILVGDCRIHYVEKGTGEPLVLLHGNGESLEYFSEQITWFSKRYRVIALDTRGHGRSSRGRAPFTLEQFALDLQAFFDALGLDQVHLLGFSDGGNIALAFGRDHPGRLKSLILNGANLNPLGMKAWVLLSVLGEYGLASLGSIFSGKWRKKKEILGLMIKEPHYGAKDLKALTMPVLVLAGDRDMIRESHTRRISRGIPGSRLVILKGSHFVARESPRQFNQAVERFLEGVRFREKEKGDRDR